MGECYKGVESSKPRGKAFQEYSVGVIPSIDDDNYIRMNGEVMGCYACKNATQLTITICTCDEVLPGFILSCGICREYIAATEGVID